MAKWEQKIKAIDTLWDMENLIEEIAQDDSISNEEYEALYNMALDMMRG